MGRRWNTPSVGCWVLSLTLKCTKTHSPYITCSACLSSNSNIAWLWIGESKTLLSYTCKRIKKLNSLVAAMNSVTLIPPTLAPWRRHRVRSQRMKQLINIKALLSNTCLSPLLPPIKNILSVAELKERIMNNYCREV